MDSRTVMSPVCSDQGTGRVIKGPTSVVTWRAWALPPRESQARLLGPRGDGRRVTPFSVPTRGVPPPRTLPEPPPPPVPPTPGGPLDAALASPSEGGPSLVR